MEDRPPSRTNRLDGGQTAKPDKQADGGQTAKPDKQADEGKTGEKSPLLRLGNDSWFGKDMGPVIALSTVFLTFWMFWYFVHIANSPIQETRNLYLAQQKLDEAKSKLEKAATDEKANLQKEVSSHSESVANAKSDLEISKEH